MHKSPHRNKLFQALLALTILLSPISPNPASATELENLVNENLYQENQYTENPQIAILLPLSGPFAPLGQALQEGFAHGFAQQIGPDLINHQYKIRFLDSEGSPETARTLIALLSSEGETVIAAGTPLNTTAWGASKACEEGGLPYLIVGADQNNLINEKSIFTFRLTQTQAADLEMLSAFIDAQEPKIQNLGIIYSESHCAIQQARRLRKFCADKNIDLAIWETYRSDGRNFYDLLNIIKERQPQLLFLATNPAAGKKLCQQGQRLEILPPLTIATPVNCIPTTSAETAPATQVANRILYPTPWPTPTDQEDLPLLENYLQAQGFAAAEVILEVLAKSPNQTSGEIVKTLETTTMTTVYGQISFSGPGQGHQNPLSWYLCSHNEDGTNQVIFPQPPGPDTSGSETETTTLETSSIATPDKTSQ